jgi:hypothetical protein
VHQAAREIGYHLRDGERSRQNGHIGNERNLYRIRQGDWQQCRYL